VLARAQRYWTKYRDHYQSAAKEFGVPVQLLMACSLTESVERTGVNPETCERQEPGYISDEKTPNRVSYGLCQLLISTAREVMKDNTIGRDWLNSPLNSLRACAAYMAKQSRVTAYDPVYAACAYNAGGLYQNNGEKNRWKLRQFPLGTANHADRFVEYYNAAVKILKATPSDGTDTVKANTAG
jgi:hypothetical protein